VIRHRPIWLLFALISLSCARSLAANTAPQISTLPTISASKIVADDTTAYTVTMTVTDADGYNDIACIRVLFNYTFAAGDQTKGRGYMAWGLADSNITEYGGEWVFADATGGGRWAYRTDQWGGTSYITPLGCSTTTRGRASGGSGSRTVVWTFTAKPAWAWNPLTNKADGWTADLAPNRVGWLPSPTEFDVVPAPCASYPSVPHAPVVSDATVNTVNVAIDPADSDTDLFAIKVSPFVDNKTYVQADGSLGVAPVYQTRAAWGTKTVTGLVSSTNYSFRARAARNEPGSCPSDYGPESSITTGIQSRTINAAASGKIVYRGVIGNSTRLDWFPSYLRLWDKTWAVLDRTCARGVAGGLDADTYNWKDMSGQGAGHTGTPSSVVPTTLDWMRLARDHKPISMLTANCRGIGPVESSGYCRFYYTDTSISTVAALAGDWVRYVNHILPTYREGDSISPADQAILDSINWYGRPKLLSPGEAPTPKVTYWEIGNEPEVPMPWCTPGVPGVSVSPADYVARYKAMSAAMRAADPSIKIGPCITTANNGNSWLEAVLDDPQCQVDFIAYHPYGPLYWYTLTYGDTAATAERGLRYMKSQQENYRQGIISLITSSGRNPNNILLITGEYNPSDWHWECGAKAARQSHALGLAETVFTFMEQGIFAACYWSGPAYCSDGTETPGYKLFEKWQETMSNYDILLDSYSDGFNTRVYTLWNTVTQKLSIWALNFSETQDMPIRLGIQNLGPAGPIEMSRLAKLSGPTSLLDINSTPYTAPPNIDWTTTDLTGTLDPADFVVTLPRATITVITFDRPVRTLPEYTPVSLGGMVVTANYPSENYLYVENEDRSFGIRVAGGFTGVAIGDRVKVTGNITNRKAGSVSIERQITTASVTKITSGPPIKPVGMNCRSVGGGPIGPVPGVKDGSGANNMGLLVTIAGKVTYVSGNVIFVDDGTNIADPSARITVAVKCPSTPTVAVGDIVRATGVVEGNLPFGWTASRRFIRARTASDIAKVL
jgi:hypothetical protein